MQQYKYNDIESYKKYLKKVLNENQIKFQKIQILRRYYSKDLREIYTDQKLKFLMKQFYRIELNSSPDTLKYVNDNLTDKIFEIIKYIEPTYDIEFEIKHLEQIVTTDIEIKIYSCIKTSPLTRDYLRKINELKSACDQTAKIINNITENPRIILPLNQPSIIQRFEAFFDSDGLFDKEIIMALILIWGEFWTTTRSQYSKEMINVGEELGKIVIELMINGKSFHESVAYLTETENEILQKYNDYFEYQSKEKSILKSVSTPSCS